MRIRENKNGENAKILNPRKFSTAKIKVHTVYCALLSLYGIFFISTDAVHCSGKWWCKQTSSDIVAVMHLFYNIFYFMIL